MVQDLRYQLVLQQLHLQAERVQQAAQLFMRHVLLHLQTMQLLLAAAEAAAAAAVTEFLTIQQAQPNHLTFRLVELMVVVVVEEELAQQLAQAVPLDQDQDLQHQLTCQELLAVPQLLQLGTLILLVAVDLLLHLQVPVAQAAG